MRGIVQGVVGYETICASCKDVRGEALRPVTVRVEGFQ